MKAIMKYEPPLVPPPRDYPGDFLQDAAGALVGVGLIVNSDAQPGVLALDKDYNNISKFLNRILGMPVELQNRLFKYFTDTLTAIMEQAKRSGRFDLGILDLGGAGDVVRRVRITRYLRRHATGAAPVTLTTLHAERGMDWTDALAKLAECSQSNAEERASFYLSLTPRNGKHTAALAVPVVTVAKRAKTSKKEQMYHIYRPNTGLQVKQESLSELEKKYKAVEEGEAESWWRAQYGASLRVCSHKYWRAACRTPHCEVGLRTRTYYVLSGSVLGVWARVEGVLAARAAASRMQVVRLKTQDGLKLVGTVIPKNCVEPLKESLASDAVSVSEEVFDETDDVK